MNKILEKLSLPFTAVSKNALALILMAGAFSSIFAQSTWILHPANGITKCLHCVTSSEHGAPPCYAGGDSGLIISSTNNNTWTKLLSGATNDILGIAVSSSLVAVGKSGAIVTYGKGSTTWNNQIAHTHRNLRGLVQNRSGLWVCVGDSGFIITSPNDSVWTTRTSGTLKCLRSISCNNRIIPDTNTVLIAVGDSGTILRSKDGILWSKQVSGTKRNLNGVCFGSYTPQDLFVTVGDSGTILTSADGKTWNAQLSATTNNLSGIYCVIDGINFYSILYVAVGDLGEIITSKAKVGECPIGCYPAVTWTSQVSGTTRNLYAATSNRDSLVVVGDSGTILTSYFPPLYTGIKQGIISGNKHNLISITNNFVRYSLLEPSRIAITLYDTKGRFVKILVDKIQQPGTYSVGIPRNVSPAVYTAVMNMGNNRINRTIVVSKK